MNKEIEKVLSELYHSLKSDVSFSSPLKLYRAAKLRIPDLKLMKNPTTNLNQMQSFRENQLRVFTFTAISLRINMLEILRSLLRVVPVRSNFGEMDWIHYDKPHYMRLSRENINNIEINIRDSTGEFVSFESGKVIVTLVFRRIVSRFYQ